MVPPDADAGSVADAIVKVVDAPFGKRPVRAHIDPTKDGADVAFAVMDRGRTEMRHGVGLSDLLTPAGAESSTARNACVHAQVKQAPELDVPINNALILKG